MTSTDEDVMDGRFYSDRHSSKHERSLYLDSDSSMNCHSLGNDNEIFVKMTAENTKLQILLNDLNKTLSKTEDEKKKLQKMCNETNEMLKKSEAEKKQLQTTFNERNEMLRKSEAEKKKLQTMFNETNEMLKKTRDEKKKLQMFGTLKVCFTVVLPLLAVLLYSEWGLVNQGHQVNHHELRLMLVGKTGAGKSASGNTILDEKAFRVESSPASVTGNCTKTNKLVEERNITVIDTPGVMDTWLTSNKMAHHAPDCITTFSYNPHIFVLVIKIGRFTVEEINAVKWIQDNFGEEALKFTMILFTGGDLLEGKPIEKFISNSVELQGLIDICEGRYHVFNNYDQTNRTQVTKLLEKIDTIIHENMGYSYIKEVHQKVQQKVQQKTREEEESKRLILEEKIKKEEEQKRAEMEYLIREEEKMKWKQQEIKAEEEAVNE